MSNDPVANDLTLPSTKSLSKALCLKEIGWKPINVSQQIRRKLKRTIFA